MSAVPSNLSSEAKDRLSLVLAFFPRVDGGLAVVLSVDLALLALLAANAPALEKMDLSVALALIPLMLIVASLGEIYRGLFPRLDGGERSLIYFRSIAALPRAEFADAFRACTAEEQIRDFLSQTWINARILTQKYDHLRRAFLFMAAAVLPWLLSIAVFAVANRNAEALFNK